MAEQGADTSFIDKHLLAQILNETPGTKVTGLESV